MKTILSILAVLLVALGIFWVASRSSTDEPQMVACTMEALICPDGSGVGRQGPQCEFTPCPNHPSFTGVLTQNGSDFRLNMTLPSDLGGQDTYSMPVRFSRVSNSLAEFIGKMVVVTGAFSQGSTLEVETINLKSAASTN